MAELNPDIAKILEGVEGADALSPAIIEALNSYAPTGGVAEADEAATAASATSEDLMTISTPEAIVKDEAGDEDGAEDVRKELEDIRTELAKERATRETAELVQKVKTELPALVVDAEDVASVMFRIKKGQTTVADFDTVMGILKAASTAVREAGTFDERGTARAENDESSPIGKIVADIMRANPSLTKQQAVSKALETDEGRKLYLEAHAS